MYRGPRYAFTWLENRRNVDIVMRNHLSPSILMLTMKLMTKSGHCASGYPLLCLYGLVEGLQNILALLHHVFPPRADCRISSRFNIVKLQEDLL